MLFLHEYWSDIQVSVFAIIRPVLAQVCCVWQKAGLLIFVIHGFGGAVLSIRVSWSLYFLLGHECKVFGSLDCN